MNKLLLCFALFLLHDSYADRVDFSEQIRPLFNRMCTGCHGGVKEAGGLSLLYKESAFGKTNHGIGIVPGKPEESMVYKVITDPPEVFDKKKGKMHRLEKMPLEKEPLTEEEIALIKRWIEEGAPWEEHWAYTKPFKQNLPKTDSSWPKNRIDHFTLAKMEEKGLYPAEKASREALLRRVSLDLTGLPPTLEEVKAFQSDQSSNAYEKQIDRLLKSGAYGEKWAGMWMDLARYSDTQGYEKDSGRVIYRYRDEVINAFNKDTPYDQFIIEQMAGDLLPNATEYQKILTAFHRNTMTNTEGGTDDEEFRVAAIVDRVNTTWEAFMGTSYGCVQCHTHPYDPIKHEEYFTFMAFFNNTADSDKNNDAPFIKTPDIYQKKQLADWQAELAELEPKVEEVRSSVNAYFGKLLETYKAKPNKVNVEALKFTKLNGNSEQKITQNEKGWVSVENDKDKAVLTLIAKTELSSLSYIELETAADIANFVLSGISVKVNEKSVRLGSAEATYEQKGFYAKDSLNLKNKEKGWAIAGGTSVEQTAWFKLAKPVELKSKDKVEITLSFESKHKKHILKDFKVKAGSGSLTTEDLLVSELINKNQTDLAKEEKAKVVEFLMKKSAGAKVVARHAELSKKIKNFKPATTPIMQDLPKDKRRVTRIFNRGSWEDLGDVVTEGVPEIFNEFKDEWPRNRLGMAKCMTHPDHPLLSRVAVNRFWEQIFGVGIVESLEDFGSQGIIPTHPKLLDDISYRFIHEHKWSVKSLLKEFVTSATYMQSSNATTEKITEDKFNSYLSRGPRFRLSSEQIRDQALAVSGLLNQKMFGPSVMPHQPGGVWMGVYNGSKWITSKNGDQYRRGLYTYWKRTSPYPSMEAFDSPSREICKTRRLRTNTPLQALVTLNDPVYMECAKEFGLLIKNHSGNLEDKLNFAIQKALCRPIAKSELAPLKKVFHDSQKEFGKSEQEAWTLVANVIMNLDEFLVKK